MPRLIFAFVAFVNFVGSVATSCSGFASCVGILFKFSFEYNLL